MLTRPKAVLIASAMHVLWIVAAVVGAAIDASAGRSRWVWMAVWAIVYSGAALWSLLARWRWAWALNALYFGGFALVGLVAMVIARSAAAGLLKYWPFMVLFSAYALLAVAMVSGAVRRYFERSHAGVGNAVDARPVGRQESTTVTRVEEVTSGVTVYRADDVAFVRYEQRNRLFALMVLPLVSAGGLFVATRIDGPIDGTTLIVTGIVGAICCLWGFRLALATIRERFLKAEWLVSANSIVWRVPGRPDVEVQRSDVRRIEQSSADLVIRGSAPRSVIAIPVGLAGFGEIRERLEQWSTIRRAMPIGLQWAYSLLLGVGTFVSPWVAFGGANAGVVACVGAVLLATAAWGLWGFQTFRLSDPNAKWATWLTFIPGLLMVVRALAMSRG